MKKIKNNKGLTGIDVVVSITIIVIVLSIVTTVYVTYSRKAKEVKRTTTATNLAMTVIEYIEGSDINDPIITNMDTSETEINSNDYGITNIPNGYTVKIKKTTLSSAASGAELINALAFQVDVTVTYKVENNNKSITLSAIKKKSGIEEAEEPNIKGNEIYNNNTLLESDVIPVKYDNGADGYVKTNQYDSEWYSISSKVFPIVVKANENDFDRNGIIQLNQCTKIYVWMPSYYIDGTNYRFCNKDGKIINYESDTVTLADSSTAVIYDYKVDDSEAEEYVQGQWIEVDSNLNSSNENYNTLKNEIFTWQ